MMKTHPNPAPSEIAAMLPVSRKEMSGAAPIDNAWVTGDTDGDGVSVVVIIDKGTKEFDGVTTSEFEAVPEPLPVRVPEAVCDGVPVSLTVCVPDDEEVGLEVGVEESVPLSEPVTDGLAPIERDAVGVRVDEAERLEVVLGVPDVVAVPVGDDEAVPETLPVPVPVGVMVDVGVMLNDSVDEPVPLALPVIVDDVDTEVLPVGELVPVGEALVVEVVEAIIDCEILIELDELGLTPNVSDDVGVFVHDAERLAVEDSVRVEVPVPVPVGELDDVGVILNDCVVDPVPLPVIVEDAATVVLPVAAAMVVEVIDGIVDCELLLEPVELGLTPRVMEAVGVCDRDAERLDIEEGVPVPVMLIVEVVEAIMDCELLSEPVELGLAPRVMEAVGVCDAERLNVEVVLPVGVLVPVWETLIVEVVEAIMDCELLSEPVELGLAPNV